MTVLEILAAARRCKKNTYAIEKTIESSAGVLQTLERIGVEFVIENMSAFIDPIYITGNGRQEHQKIIQFIEKKLKGWSD